MDRTERLKRLKPLFEKKYIVAENGCWNWTAAKQQSGYGYVTTCGITTNTKPAHSVSYMLYVDPNHDLDAGNTIHHKCFNVGCVNPKHLLLMSSYQQALHQQHTALGVLDRMEVEFPSASPEIAALRARLRALLGIDA